jgi:hypothetical protein
MHKVLDKIHRFETNIFRERVYTVPPHTRKIVLLNNKNTFFFQADVPDNQGRAFRIFPITYTTTPKQQIYTEIFVLGL